MTTTTHPKEQGERGALKEADSYSLEQANSMYVRVPSPPDVLAICHREGLEATFFGRPIGAAKQEGKK